MHLGMEDLLSESLLAAVPGEELEYDEYLLVVVVVVVVTSPPPGVV